MPRARASTVSAYALTKNEIRILLLYRLFFSILLVGEYPQTPKFIMIKFSTNSYNRPNANLNIISKSDKI